MQTLDSPSILFFLRMLQSLESTAQRMKTHPLGLSSCALQINNAETFDFLRPQAVIWPHKEHQNQQTQKREHAKTTPLLAPNNTGHSAVNNLSTIARSTGALLQHGDTLLAVP